jgi:hypothetical protein
MPYSIPLLKYKLRQLRRLEQTIRSKNPPAKSTLPLVWDLFFSTKPGISHVKYPISKIMAMSDVEYKCVIEEYFLRVYFQNWKENGYTIGDVYNSQLLEQLDLQPYAGLQDIKKRFRELAMRYHPDHGGDAEKFLELMGIYEQLTGGKE